MQAPKPSIAVEFIIQVFIDIPRQNIDTRDQCRHLAIDDASNPEP
jgi:hypothetical protein